MRQLETRPVQIEQPKEIEIHVEEKDNRRCLKKLCRRIIGLEAQLREALSLRDKYQYEAETLRRVNPKLESRIEELEELLRRAERQASELNGENIGLKVTIKALEEEIERLRNIKPPPPVREVQEVVREVIVEKPIGRSFIRQRFVVFKGNYQTNKIIFAFI